MKILVDTSPRPSRLPSVGEVWTYKEHHNVRAYMRISDSAGCRAFEGALGQDAFVRHFFSVALDSGDLVATNKDQHVNINILEPAGDLKFRVA